MEFNATFLVSAISFIVFTFLMNMIFYKPLTKVMTERQNHIDETYNEAKQCREGAFQLLKEREDRLNQAAEDAKKIMIKKIDEANSSSKTQTLRAKTKSNKVIDETKLSLQDENQKVKDDLKSRIKDLAENIASKILEDDIKIENFDEKIADRILS